MTMHAHDKQGPRPGGRRLRRTFPLAVWLLLAVAALAVWPLSLVTAVGYAVASRCGWPASRLGRQAGWTLPMAAVWIAAESARGWRAMTLNPVRDGASGWPHLTGLTVVRVFLLVAPVTIPAGLALAALVWAWRISLVPNGTGTRPAAARGVGSESRPGTPAAAPPRTAAAGAADAPVVLPAPRRAYAPGPYPREVPAGPSSRDGVLGSGAAR